MSELVDLFRGIPNELATFIIAMLPIAELRGAIPVGILAYGIEWYWVVPLAVAGNMAPVALLLWFLEPVSRALRKRFKLWDRFFSWLFARTRKKYYQRFEKAGDIALIAFVAVPLPVTGGWTGSVAAFIFGVPRLKAFGLILVGVLIASVIVSAVTLGVFNLL